MSNLTYEKSLGPLLVRPIPILITTHHCQIPPGERTSSYSKTVCGPLFLLGQELGMAQNWEWLAVGRGRGLQGQCESTIGSGPREAIRGKETSKGFDEAHQGIASQKG